MSNDLFTNNPQITTEVNYVEAMSQKFNKEGKLDVEGLAKGKFEADQFIETMKTEMAELRKELDTRISLQTFLDQQKNTQVTPPVSSSVPTSQNQNTQGNEPVPTKKEDIAELVKQAILQEKTALTREQNIAVSVSELQKMFGNSYVDKLTKVSQDLGVGKEFLNELAATQPKAFLKLVSDNTAPKTTPTNAFVPPRTQQTQAPSSSAGARNWNYYQNLKKSDPKTYFASTTQNEMHREALRQGDAFYN